MTHCTDGRQRGIRIDVDGSIAEVSWTPETSLATMQEAVGGLIQMIDLPNYGLMLVCHDEAKLQDGWRERINHHATALFSRDRNVILSAWEAIAGPVLVISNRDTDDGDAVGLSIYGLTDVRCWLATGHLEPQGLGAR